MNTINIDKQISTSAAINVWIKDRMVYIELADFRIIAFPADRFIRLKSASIEQLEKVKIRHQGMALRWEELDEDISIDGILQGNFQLSM